MATLTEESKLTRSQTKTFGPTPIDYGGEQCMITAVVRYDDECKNGHNSFSITGDIRSMRNRWEAGGCLHEEIAKAFPELQKYIKWHLCSSDGPMHYPGNALYHAGDKDCWGLRIGEKRQLRNGKTGVPAWKTALVDKEGKETEAPKKYVDSPEMPPDPELKLAYVPWCREGEGKARELDHARSSAAWPEATDAELMADDLKEKLLARLPQLIADFRADMLELGFTW